MRIFRIFSLMILASFSFLGGLSEANAQDLGQLEQDLSKIQSSVSTLENEYLKPAVLASRYKTEARFNDAKVAYYLEDYQGAAVLFVDIVRKENQGFGSYREAHYLLGDSLFELRNYQGARKYLKDLIDLGAGPYFEEAASRYLEVAFESRSFDGVEEVLDRVRNVGAMSPALHYIAGKALYQQGNYAAARQSFQLASAEPRFRALAEYFRGITLAAEGKVPEAKGVFEALTSNTQMGNERDVEVFELAYIARGRLAYEQGDYDSAIDMYARIPRASEHFETALWEQTWTLVAKEMFREARRNVEILLYSEPDERFVPQAKLLKADLSVRLGEYDFAEDDFKDVLTTFQPVKDEMDAFVAQRGDLRSFFQGMIEDDLEGVEAQAMPPLVERWLDSDATIRTASRLIEDVRSVNAEIAETRQVLAEVNARLNSSARVQSFPKLAEGVALGIETESALLSTRRQLLDAHFNSVEPRLDATTRAQWQQIQNDLDELDDAYQKMPRNRETIAEREQKVYSEYARLQRALDQVNAQIDGQKAILAGVDVYIENQYGEPLSEEQAAEIGRLKSEVGTALKELESVQRDLQLELKMARSQVGVGDPVSKAEQRLRKRYGERIDEAFALLERAGQNPRVTALRNQIRPLSQRLATYFDRMNSLVDDKISEIRKDVENEETLLAQHRDSLDELIYASQDGAGVLAYVNFMQARSEFNALILRAEVGLVDVMWQKKEEMSTSINQLFEDRTTQLRLLEDSFKEVR